MRNLALTIFTICIQAAIGIMVFVAIETFLNKDATNNYAVIAAAVLAVLGFIASLLHLGRPSHATNALKRFYTSWLSREIWATSIFVGVTVIAALLIVFKSDEIRAINALVATAAVIGLVDVYVMASIYTFTSVPAWQHGSIYVEFYAATISMGAVLFFVTSKREFFDMQQLIAITVVAAVALQVAAMVLYYIDLGIRDGLAARKSLSILNGLSLAMMIKWLFILVGSGLIIFPLLTNEIGVCVVFSGTALVIIGQTVGRYIFYDNMIVSRVGLN